MSFQNLIRSERLIFSLIIGGLVVIVLGLFVFSWEESFFDFGATVKADKAGQLGDLIGGVAGSLWALAGVILFYKALTEQREDFRNNKKALDLQVEALQNQLQEFKLNREELKSSRHVYESQSKTLKFQQFDSNFYSLINVYLTIKNNIFTQNKNFFHELVNSLGDGLGDDKNIADQHKSHVDRYLEKYGELREHLSNYFRVLYRVITIIEENREFTDEDKWFYAKILRAQISDYEVILLFYNSCTPQGKKSRKHILKYNLLKHLPTLKKAEYTSLVEKQVDQKLYLVFNEIELFLVTHFEKFYDVEFDLPKIEESMDTINAICGIYFDTDVVTFKIILPDTDLSNVGIKLDSGDFSMLLCNFIYDKIILCTYADSTKVSIDRSVSSYQDKIEFVVEIETKISHQLNKDSY